MALDEAAERRTLCEWQPHLEFVSFEVKSPTDRGYNCIAWAAGDDTKIWSPAVGVGGKLLGGYHWPPGPAAQFPTVAATEAMFEGRGYIRTQVDDVEVEESVEKVAIFGYDSMGLVTHAARQCSSGLWASKMGDNADIEHSLRDVEGGIFGELRSVMRKDPEAAPPPSPRPVLIVAERRRRL
jgi:hypothetical protein